MTTDKELPKDDMEFSLQIVGWASTIMQPEMDSEEGKKIAEVINNRLAQRNKEIDELKDQCVTYLKERDTAINQRYETTLMFERANTTIQQLRAALENLVSCVVHLPKESVPNNLINDVFEVLEQTRTQEGQDV